MTHEISTRALIDSLCEGDPNDTLTFDDLLDRFRHRAFGLFLLVALLPVFLPVPMGMGAISGPLLGLLGLQLLVQFTHPWLPAFIARRGFQRSGLVRFRDRFGIWLTRIERWCKPRNEWIFDNPIARAFTGLLLCVLAGLLALPLPGTNYPFGFVLLFYAFALIERDGRLMMIAWVLGLIEIAVMAYSSGAIVNLISGWLSG